MTQEGQVILGVCYCSLCLQERAPGILIFRGSEAEIMHLGHLLYAAWTKINFIKREGVVYCYPHHSNILSPINN